MKKLYILFFFSVLLLQASAQIFWNEGFGTGCDKATLANGVSTTNGAWAVTDVSAPQTYANEWFISAHANNTGAGNCATDCSGGLNKTLHISNTAFGLAGLSADSGSYLTGLFCTLGYCSTTHKRAESPVIDCSGKTTIQLSFLYYEGGDVQGGTNGDCSVWYFDGSGWSMIDPLPKTLNGVCGGTAYGAWTNYTIALPVSADNNANVKIGFQWDNDDSGAGTDPSAAVDDIALSTPSTALPVAGFNSDVTSGCDSVCVTFTDTSLNGTSRNWSFPGGIPSTSTSATQIVCYNATGNYDVTLVSVNGTGNDTITQNSYVTVAQTPVPDFSVSDQSLCVGDCATFTDLTAGNVTGYTWTFQGAFPLNSNQQNPSFICYLNPGTFDVTLTVENGTCNNAITRVAYMNVNQPAQPVVTLSGDTLTSTPALAYQWFEVTSGIINSAFFQSYVVTQTGYYYVCVHDAFGCNACSDTTYVDITGIDEQSKASFHLYPNPVHDELSFGATPQEVLGISILDVMGKNILRVEPKTNTVVKSVDVASLASGLYWIEVEASGKIFRSKFVKE